MKLSLGVLALMLAGTSFPALAADTVLYRGGPIITMDGETPHVVEAVVTHEGRITFVGKEKDARKRAGSKAHVKDLAGSTMLPGFIDAHSHFSAALMNSVGLDLSDRSLPPVQNIEQLQAVIRQHVADNPIADDDWLFVWQYDQEKLEGKQHITRAQLDAVVGDRPVLVMHVSMHGAVANSAALAAAGIDETTPVPEGGLMLRDDKGKLNGVLMESALFSIMAKLPQRTEEQKLAAIEHAQNRYFAEGYTHAQDGATQAGDIGFLTSAAARERIKIDLALLPFSTQLDGLLAQPDLQFGRYNGHVKLQGIKFVLDGSPQARTAYFTQDYKRGSPQGHHPWHGAPIFKTEQFQAEARKAHDRGWQLFVHANGDAAIDMAIAGFDSLGLSAADNRRPIVIHS